MLYGVNKINLEDLLKNKKQWSSADLADLIQLARGSGRTPFITMIDDPNSPEGKAVKDYIDSHHLLPPNYQDTTEQEIAEQGKRLFDSNTTIDEKKKILML